MNDAFAYGAAGLTGTGLVVSWLAQANEVLQFIALVVTIVTGLYAIRHYRRTHQT